MAREIDDVYKRQKYKKEKFGDKKSTVDEYTGERIFSGNSRDSKYKHPISKTADMDHITPVKVVDKRYKKLKPEQKKKLANNIHNIAVVNSKINRSKGDLENSQYIRKNRKNLKLKTKIRMVSRQIDSRTVMDAEATVMYAQNLKDDIIIKSTKLVQQTKDSIKKANTFIDDATEKFTSEKFAEINRSGLDEAATSAMFAATLSITKNTILVCKGEEETGEALKQVLIDTSSSAVLGYVAGTIEGALGLADTSTAYLLVNATVQTSKHMIAYINGEIDGKEMAENIAESSIYLVSAYVGKILGSKLIPIPYVGAYIGEMITTAICAEVISTIKLEKEFDKQNARTISLYKQAEREIRASQARLTELVQGENNQLIETIRSGFEDILSGLESNSYETIKKGLSTIGSKFGFSENDFSKDFVTRENLFSPDTIIFD